MGIITITPALRSELNVTADTRRELELNAALWHLAGGLSSAAAQSSRGECVPCIQVATHLTECFKINTT